MELDAQVRVFHLAQTEIDAFGVQQYLNFIGAKDWDTDTASSAQRLIEIAGRVCYRAFGIGLNKNITKVREGNHKYLANIIKSKHGSVLTHASDTYIIYASRVFTHELVRHQVGTAFSQESMRYVRLDDSMALYYPDAFKELPEPQRSQLRLLWETAMKGTASLQVGLASLLDLDDPSTNFEMKKKLTSSMRRAAPQGVMTSIVMTSNHRNWRHLIAMRTAATQAEEEIRKVFQIIADDLYQRYPNIYFDMNRLSPDGSITFENEKI